MSSAPPDAVAATAEWFRKHFQPAAARGLRVRIRLEVTGPQPGRVGLAIDDEALRLVLDDAAEADLVLTASADDWLDVASGRANAEMLAMAGRIRMEGDLGLALKLRSLFRRSA